MSIELIATSVAISLIVLAIVVLYVQVRSLKKEAEHLHTLVVAMKAVPKVVTTSAERIAEWEARMAELKPGSPKHTAYRNRLKLVGAIKD